MGTNYYYHAKPPCPTCGHSEDRIHIGKSSAGWCFSLHVYPEDGIKELADWLTLFAEPGSHIKDEYGDSVTSEEMLACITIRGPREKKETPYGYESWEEFHRKNASMDGPNGMLRHKLDRHCVGHGPGTYDYITGYFS